MAALPHLVAAFLLLASAAAAQPDLRGHGGPVRALAVAPDGRTAISGSFDSSAIVWALESGRALAVLRAHDGAINAVAAHRGGYISAGEDGRIAFWGLDAGNAAARIIKPHESPVAGLAISLDGARLASASWDRTIAITDIASGALLRRLEGHSDSVNAVAFMGNGERVVSAGYDATLRIWPAEGPPVIATLPAALNAVAVTREGLIAAGGANGVVYLLDASGRRIADIDAGEIPAIALAVSPDGEKLAAASPRGSVTFIDLAKRAKLFTLTGPGLPVWSAAFTPDGRQLLTGGSDRLVRRWDARSGDHLGAVASRPASDDFGPFAKMPGAEVFKACAVCHTLTPDDGARAGPTLHGLFGRKAGSLRGYNYSPAFSALDIVWTPETVSRLFEIGPQAYTPGTKMPEQTVGNAQERQALIDFLIAATAPRK